MFCFLLCCFVSTFKRWRGEAKESSRKRITKENEKRKKNRRHRTQWTRVEWKKERIRGDRGGENHGATRKPDGAISLSFFLFSLARRFIIFFCFILFKKKKEAGAPWRWLSAIPSPYLYTQCMQTAPIVITLLRLLRRSQLGLFQTPTPQKISFDIIILWSW